MVLFVLHEQLGSFVVPACDAHIIFLVWLVIVCKSPVDQSQVTSLVVDYYIQRLHITVHDAVRVGELQCFQDFVSIQTDINVIKALGDNFRFNVRDVLENKTGRFAH